MRKKNIDIARDEAQALVKKFLAALEEARVQMNIDQHILVLQRLKEAIDGNGAGKEGGS
jgi:hypothetical protein